MTRCSDRAEYFQVVTGGIKTAFFAHAGETELPETSPYYPGRETLGPWMKGDANVTLQPSQLFLIRCLRPLIRCSTSRGVCPKSDQQRAKDIPDHMSIRWLRLIRHLVCMQGSLEHCNGRIPSSHSQEAINKRQDLVLWAMGVPDLKKAIFGSKSQKKTD